MIHISSFKKLENIVSRKMLYQKQKKNIWVTIKQPKKTFTTFVSIYR